MDKETNLENINQEFQTVKDELKDILLDIRVHLMEAQSPIPHDLEKAQLKEELKSQRG